MRGRKPNIGNVVPMRADDALSAADLRERQVASVVSKLRPKGLDKEHRAEWDRVATILAAPHLDRLKPHYVDTIYEYCVAVVKLRRLRRLIEDAAKAQAKKSGKPVDVEAAQFFITEGRHGRQPKTLPQVAQIHEVWRQWRALVGELGLSPQAERGLIPGQGDLFDVADQYFS